MDTYISKNQAKRVLGPHIQHVMDALFLAEQAWKEQFAPAHSILSVTTRAQIFHDYWYHHMAELCFDEPGFELGEFRNQQYVTFGDHRLLMRIKLFDRRFMPVEPKSRQAQDFVEQGELEGFPECDRLHIGYRMELHGLALKDAFIALPKGDMNLWAIQTLGKPTEPTIQGLLTASQLVGDVYEYLPISRSA